jgi:hypothetical protein
MVSSARSSSSACCSVVGLHIELLGSGEVVVFALLVLVTLDVSRDEFKW